MAVTVSPAQFAYVQFDAGTIEGLLDGLLERLAITDWAVRVDVDETSPIVRVLVEGDDPVVLKVDSGAFEDPRRPRTLSIDSTVTNAGRALLRVRDRADGSFSGAPADADLTLAQIAAWDAYSVGRLGRLGYRVFEPRWRYNFRNRLGFTDAVDAAFDRVWRAEALTWAELSSISDEARAA